MEVETKRTLCAVERKQVFHGRRAARVIKSINTGCSAPIVSNYLLKALEDQGFELDVSRDNKSVFDPAELFERLNKYERIDLSDARGHPFWRQAWDVTRKVFGSDGRTLSTLKDENEFREAIKPSKSSGAPYFQKKGDSFSKDLRLMGRVLNREVAPPPCVSFHRVQHGEVGPKVRLVWGYPSSLTLGEAQYAKPLIDTFLRKQTPMAFGYRKHELWADLMRINNCNFRLSLDFSGFDASVQPELILEAFDVLKTWFSKDDIDNFGWDTVVHYFVHTPILMPDGYIWQKHVGIPSGSYFTQLIGSIINYFALQFAMLCSYGDVLSSDYIRVLGDDSILGLDYCKDVNWWGDIQVSLTFLGLRPNVEKSQLSRTGKPFHFLGHYWRGGVADRIPIDVAKRLAMPERPMVGAPYPDLIRQRVVQLIADSRAGWSIARHIRTPMFYGVWGSLQSYVPSDQELQFSGDRWLRELRDESTFVNSVSLFGMGLFI